jgi:6-pyruvoyltetrahydropterin/6-carboxytetrahydropterin synthase
MKHESTKIIELGSCAFRQWRADSHCKYVHGYRLVAKFWFECEHLDARNWVVDFGGLKELKQALEHQFDHTLCIAGDDPLLETFIALGHAGAALPRIMDNGVGIERTAEWCLETADRHVRHLTNGRCWVKQVEVWEHEKNSAIAIATAAQTEHTIASGTVSDAAAVTVTTTIPPALENVTVVNAGLNIESGAPLTNKVTRGISNPYAGTSWGT